MDLRPTHEVESQPFVTPAQAGVHFRGFPLSRE